MEDLAIHKVGNHQHDSNESKLRFSSREGKQEQVGTNETPHGSSMGGELGIHKVGFQHFGKQPEHIDTHCHCEQRASWQ